MISDEYGPMFMGVSLRVTGWGIGWIENDLFYIDDSVTFSMSMSTGRSNINF